MTNRPKSHRALVLSVLSAKHPDIDAVDRAILAAIAQNASDLGAGSRPGNAMLCAVAGIGERALRYRTAKLVRLGLVTRTECHGRGLASVYRVNWVNPAYPDRSPNGRESYTEKTGNLDCPFSDDKTGKREPENRQSETEKPAKEDPKTGNLGLPHIPRTTQSQPTPTPAAASAPNNGATAGGGGRHTFLTAKDEWTLFKRICSKLAFGEFAACGKRTSELRALVEKYGALIMAVGFRKWLGGRDTDGLKMLGAFFLDEWDGDVDSIRKSLEDDPHFRAEMERLLLTPEQVKQREADEEKRMDALARMNVPQKPQVQLADELKHGASHYEFERHRWQTVGLAQG